MDFETNKEGEMIVLTPKIERLNAVNSQEFKDSAFKMIKDQCDGVVLNLEHIEFIDSSGIGALVSMLKELEREKKHFSVCGVNNGVKNLFKLTGLEKVLKITDSKKGS
ncbi:MAG: STAS domain-containing protein [Chlamydiia bacterium]|nr:STAS domain-containing protein [Chlamydiia bacterium]